MTTWLRRPVSNSPWTAPRYRWTGQPPPARRATKSSGTLPTLGEAPQERRPLSGADTTTHKITSGLSEDTRYYFRVISTRTKRDRRPAVRRRRREDPRHKPPPPWTTTPTTTALIEIANLAQLKRHALGFGRQRGIYQRGLHNRLPKRRRQHGLQRNRRRHHHRHRQRSVHRLRTPRQHNRRGPGRPSATERPPTPAISTATTIPIPPATAGRTPSPALNIDLSASSGDAYAGLFGVIGSGATVSNVALTSVSVTATVPSSNSSGHAYAGALAGKSARRHRQQLRARFGDRRAEEYRHQQSKRLRRRTRRIPRHRRLHRPRPTPSARSSPSANRPPAPSPTPADCSDTRTPEASRRHTPTPALKLRLPHPQRRQP